MTLNGGNAASGLATGMEMFALAERLYLINRSITGTGVRETLKIISEIIPGLSMHEVPTGTKAFDWTVPDEWNIATATITDPDGGRVVDFANHNLHVMSYSIPIDAQMSLEELQPHLHSLPDQPDKIPYVTSYYKRDWGFCLTHRTRESLLHGTYHVKIDSTIEPGSLTYGELVIPGEHPDEILLSANVCHPSMANNELSGPVVTTFLARWLASQPRKYTYRIIFVPETIGALVYLSRHLQHLQSHVDAGFVLTCCGDAAEFSFMPSRTGGTYADRLSRRVLSKLQPGFREYSFLQRGSDERQYCSPLADLPVVSIMRSKYHEYPEYHTSNDDLSFITPGALQQSLEVYVQVLLAAESNCIPLTTVVGEPHLSKYGLYPATGGQINQSKVSMTLDLLAFSDGQTDLLEISDRTGHDVLDLRRLTNHLAALGLLQFEHGFHT